MGKSYSVLISVVIAFFCSIYPELQSIIGVYLLERFGQRIGGLTFLPSQIQQSLIAELQGKEKTAGTDDVHPEL